MATIKSRASDPNTPKQYQHWVCGACKLEEIGRRWIVLPVGLYGCPHCNTVTMEPDFLEDRYDGLRR